MPDEPGTVPPPDPQPVGRPVNRVLRRTVTIVGWLLVHVGWLLVLAAMGTGLVLTDQRVGGDLDWTQVAGQPVTAQTVVLAATAVGWILWCVLAYYTLAVPAVDRWIHRRPVRLHVPVPLYQAVSAVTGAIVLLTNAVATRHPPTPPAPPDPTPATTASTGNPHDPSADRPPAPSTTSDVATAPTGSSDRHTWGWLPWPAVGAALATLALISADRRRHYHPQPLTTRPRVDADPVPVLPGLAPDPDQPTDTILPAPATPVLGTCGDGWLDLAQLPQPLALTGPGAHDAARGLLAVTATHPDNPPTVLITAADTRTLLGDHPDLHRWLTTLPGIHVTDDLPELLDHLDRHTHTTPPTGPDVRTLLLHLPRLDEHTADRLDTILAGHRPALAVVLLHPTPAATRWHITPDGDIDLAPATAPRPAPSARRVPRRLVVLNPTAAHALLTNAHHATPPAATAAPLTMPPDPRADPDTDTPLPTPATPPARRDRDGPRRLHLTVLGPPTVSVPQDDGTARQVHFPRRACLHLLVYLAAHHAHAGADAEAGEDGWVTADELKEALWPDVPGRSARGRFHTAASVLDATLQQAAGVPVLQHHTDPTNRRRTRYRLDPDQISVDLWQIHHLLDLAATHPDTRRELLHRAADHVTGTLATGLTADWLHHHRDAITDQLTDLFHTLAADEPDHHTAIAVLHRAIRVVAPTTEHLYRDLMHRHAALGNPHDVHRTYNTLVDRLAARGTPPDPATRQLLDQLTQSVAGTVDSHPVGRHPR